MGQEIIDLDLMLGEPLTVRLGGHEWQVPADIPAPLYLGFQALIVKIADAEAGDGDANDSLTDLYADLYDRLLDLFRRYQPDTESLPATLPQLLRAVPAIYGGQPVVPPPRAKSPTTKGGGSRTKSSRSSRS